MATIKYDSEIGERIVSNSKEASTSIKNDIADKVLTDYSALIDVGLFNTQLQNISKAAKTYSESLDNFSSLIAENKDSWAEVQEDSTENVEEFSTDVETSPYYSSSPTSSYPTTSYPTYTPSTSSPSLSASTPTDVSSITKGKEVSTSSIKEFLTKIDSTVLPILLQKINKLANGEDLIDLLTDVSKSNILVKILKEILGEVNSELLDVDLDSEIIQKTILEKINTKGVDITTEEGRTAIEKTILELLNKNVDESIWNKLLYGENTLTVSALGGNWVIAKTVQDLNSYASYISSSGVRQNANTAEWGDSCLAFAGAHAYDLYAGTRTSGPAAANYAHGGQFKDFMSDSKEEVLAKIYEEIMNGRPMVLQVNGNKAGTSRHFVTVVGFKEGVTSAKDLKETDLLIIDSWDGKIERMDTETSRFMTSGAQCHKDYSGYRLRVLKA